MWDRGPKPQLHSQQGADNHFYLMTARFELCVCTKLSRLHKIKCTQLRSKPISFESSSNVCSRTTCVTLSDSLNCFICNFGWTKRCMSATPPLVLNLVLLYHRLMESMIKDCLLYYLLKFLWTEIGEFKSWNHKTYCPLSCLVTIFKMLTILL